MSAVASPWVRSYARRPGAVRRRLLCCPYAGGAASAYQSWARHLPADVELLALQYPGREERRRETPFTNLISLVETASVELMPLLADKPYAIFGHSLGALVGFELARQAERDGLPAPQHLFVSGASAPQVPTHRDPPRHLWPHEPLLAELARIGGTPRELLDNRELMSLVLPMLRADFALVDTYRFEPGGKLGAPITAFGGLEDHDVSRAMLQAWRERSTGAFAMAMFAGDHFFIHAVAPLLAGIVADALDQARDQAGDQGGNQARDLVGEPQAALS